MENQIQNINAVEPKEKYSLEKTIEEKLELRIFFMGLTSDLKPPENVTKLVGVVAYRHSDALEKAHKTWAGSQYGGMMVFSKEDSETIKNLLQFVNLENPIILPPPPAVTLKSTPEADKVMPIERFKASLIMATAEYVKDENDRTQLRRIISNINVTSQV